MGGKLVNNQKISSAAATVSVDKVKEIIGSEGVYVAGSLRRGKSEVGDLDIVIVRDEAVKDLDFRLKTLVGVDLTHRKTCSFVFEDAQIDLNLCYSRLKGSYLLHWTGSTRENVRLRKAAKKKGLKLSQNGLVTLQGQNLSEGKSEQDIYKMLGLEYVEPKNR